MNDVMVELTLNGLLCMPVFAPSCIEEGRGWQVGTSGCGAKSGRPEIERVQCFLDSITLRFPCLICHEFAPVISQSQRHFFLCKRIKVCEFFPILLKQSVFQRHLRTDFVELVMPVVFLTKVTGAVSDGSRMITAYRASAALLKAMRLRICRPSDCWG